MPGRWKRCGWWLVVMVGGMLVLPAVGRSEDKVLVEWRFAEEGDLQGWTLGGQIADLAVTGGVLRGRPTGSDPILFGPVFEIEARPMQRVEIKMKTTQAGQGQLFWTQTLEGKFGGFSQEKCETFDAQGDGQFHVYRIDPFWHAAGKIIRLRFDPPAAGPFEVAWIRIVDRAPGLPSSARRWDRQTGWQGWRAWQQVSEPVVDSGQLRVASEGKTPMLMSPVLSLPAAEHPYVCLRMATTAGSSGRVFCVSSTQFGWDDLSFPLVADGKMHSYTIDVGRLNKWRDTIVLLGLQPTDAEGATVTIESVEIAPRPTGPAEFAVTYFGKAEGVNRAGRPAEVICAVRNRGGQAAENVQATLVVPEGVTILGEATQAIGRLTRSLPQRAVWRIATPRVGKVELAVRIEAPGVAPAGAAASMEFTAAPRVPKTSYVPEPRPVKSKHEIGVFYFPGWDSMTRWRPILDYPDRKPVLGWYDESNPECADWQIKWAVEHGIDFFMVDWYWCQGARHLDHWLHNAYRKAKYRKYLKWAVMWANHNRPGTHSAEDWREVTQYWIDHYFGMEEYYRIDGRPAVFLWSPANICRDVGGSEEAAKLYAMSQQMARQAGYKGIYFVAMSSHETEHDCRELKAEGYEGITSYHGFQLAARRAGSRRFPFADVVETSPTLWKQEDERASGLLYMPIVDTGWSSEPWHHDRAMVIEGRTPELFGALCRKARAYADQTGKRIIALGPWNEWGEGSYIEPFTESGFDYLDQLRAAFCEPGDYPPNLVPADLGLGPYDLPPVPLKTAWQFDTEGDSEGWAANGDLVAEARGGVLSGESKGSDPVLMSPGLQIDTEAVGGLVIRMRSTADQRGQIFWATTDSQISEANSLHFPIIGDGQFHEYRIDLRQSPQWRGLVVALRFDPANEPGVRVAIDRIEFVK